MPTLLQSELIVNDSVAQALGRIRQQALVQYPKEAARITRGHAIAVQGGVHLDGHGLAAVQSQRHPETWYTVNGHCTCHDAPGRPLVAASIAGRRPCSSRRSRTSPSTVICPSRSCQRRMPSRAGRNTRPRTKGRRAMESRSTASPSFSNRGSSSSGQRTSGYAGTVNIMRWR